MINKIMAVIALLDWSGDKLMSMEPGFKSTHFCPCFTAILRALEFPFIFFAIRSFFSVVCNSSLSLHFLINYNFLILNFGLDYPLFLQFWVTNKNYVHPTGGWTYYFCFFRRPASHLVSRHFR